MKRFEVCALLLVASTADTYSSVHNFQPTLPRPGLILLPGTTPVSLWPVSLRESLDALGPTRLTEVRAWISCARA